MHFINLNEKLLRLTFLEKADDSQTEEYFVKAQGWRVNLADLSEVGREQELLIEDCWAEMTADEKELGLRLFIKLLCGLLVELNNWNTDYL